MAKKLYKILSIDGGGIRGVIPGQILTHVESWLQEIKDDPNLRIADHFDMIAGTSTGGILACAYLSPENGKAKFTAPEVVDLYFERGDEIFDIPLFHKIRTAGGLLDEKYPSHGIEDALKDYFNKLELKDLLKPCLITAYDIKRRKGHFFRQHLAKDEPGRNFYVKDVARSTSAAPTYFECARIKSRSRSREAYPLVDGGVFVNNPTLCAYAEARKWFKKPGVRNKKATAVDLAILSLGTGSSDKSYSYSEAKDWGMVEWVKPIIDIMMSGVADTVDYQLGQIYDAVDATDQYLRINPSIPAGVNPEMDDASRENMKALKKLGDDVAGQYKDKLQTFLKI